MKYFFWLGISAYVFLYFFAAWVYDDFSMPVAIALFVMMVAFVYWRYQRHLQLQAELLSQDSPPAVRPANRPTLSIWHSPIPYVAVFAIVVIMLGFGM